MTSDDIHQPHDKFFRLAFSDPATLRAFLRAYLDPKLTALLDWDTLRPEPGTFVDEQMKAFEVDLLASVNLHGEKARIYCLCEHQSSEDGLMALRLLSYMVRIWNEEAKGQTGLVRLTPIIPLVVAQDSRVWKTSTQFHDLFQLAPDKWSEVSAFTPDFAFRLLQLVELPFEGIEGTPDGKLVLRALKAQPMGQLLGDPVWEPSLLKQVSRELLEYLIRYAWNEDVDKQQFGERLKELPRTDLDPETMTLAQRIRQEGREEGIEKGSLDTALGFVCAVLEERFGRVPEGLREAVLRLREPGRAKALLPHAVRCASLEEFAAQL